MDRNPNLIGVLGGLIGQARKSLWIEIIMACPVPETACGSKHQCGTEQLLSKEVRLVRACGSKLTHTSHTRAAPGGQARKSLWIETFLRRFGDIGFGLVRLVRACGLRFYWRKEVWIPGIRDRQMKSVSRN